MQNEVKAAVRSFMVESFLFGDTAAMPADAGSLLESGVIDSTGVLELVAFLEDHFHVTLADSDIVPENLDSLDRIAAFVGKRAHLLAA